MAEEKKTKAFTDVKTAADWVEVYYGDDSRDFSKKNKIRHIIRICQFGAVCFKVSKNSKKAHTDLFESNYTTIDTNYSNAAEIIIRLLSIRFKEGRALTQTDFDECGGRNMFGSQPNYAQIVEDYIGPGGMVDMCEGCFPKPDPKDLIDPKKKEKVSDIKNLPDAERAQRICNRMTKSIFLPFIEDFNNVKSDYNDMLTRIADPEAKTGVMSGSFLEELYAKTSEKGTNMQRETKDKKSKIDFTIKDDIEKAVEIRYDLAKKTTKVVALGAVATASIGAVVGGVFWPAFLVVPTYSLAKRWLPDWSKSLGAAWGHFEKSMRHRFERQKIDSYYHYMVSFMETGGKPKLRLKDRFFLTPDIKKCLKKGAKSASVAATYEGTDGEIHESEISKAKRATSAAMGNLLNATDADKLVPADAAPILQSKIEAIKKESATFENFIYVARTYKAWQSNLSTDAQFSIEMLYSEKLLECAENLIFKTKMKTLTDHKDKVEKMFADDSAILEPVKTVMPDTLEKIKRYVTFASKELSGLKDEWKGETLYEYIFRDLDDISDINVGSCGFKNSTDAKLNEAIGLINALTVNPSDYREVISGNKKLSDIQAVIGDIQNDADKKEAGRLLTSRMTSLFGNAYREDSRVSYQAILGGSFNGKNTLNDVFEKIKNMTYETIGNAEYTQLIKELTSPTKINPPAMGRYLCSKISKQAYDVFDFYVTDTNIAEFKTNLPKLIEYLQKLNSCSLLNQQQKAKLTANVQCYVSEAFDKYVKNMSIDFIGQYDLETVRRYHEEDYSNSGLKTLFRTDKSSTVVDIEKSLSSLKIAMNDVHTNLKFNGKTICAIDRGIIGKILLRDESKGFEKIKVRTADDELVKFLAYDLKVSSSYTKADLTGKDSTTIENVIKGSDTKPTPLYQLIQKCEKIDRMKSVYDQYAAVVALKNKAIYEFRQCLVTLAYTYGVGDGGATNWLGSDKGIKMYDAVVSAWTNGKDSLFSKIDKKIKELIGMLDPDKVYKSEYLSATEMKNHKGTYSLSALEDDVLSK